MLASLVVGQRIGVAPERDDLRVAVSDCLAGGGGVRTDTRIACEQHLFTSVPGDRVSAGFTI
jgi:hypothetical protein